MSEEKINTKLQNESIQIPAFERDFDMDDHRITMEELCTKYNTDLCLGLRQTTAEAHLFRDGKNLIKRPRRTHKLFRLVKCLFCGVSLLYWLAALFSIIVITVLIVAYKETAVPEICVLASLVFNALFVGICFYTQDKKSNHGETVPSSMNYQTEVIRDGGRKKLPVEELAVGDLILLKFGDQIPADVRIIESQNFKVDNVGLTGVHDAQPIYDKPSEKNPLDSSNIAFFPGKTVEGTARGIVIRTGERTLYGWMFAGRAAEEKLICPVTMEIIHCLNMASAFAAIIALIFCGIFWLISENRKGTDTAMVAFIVILAAVPEELYRAMLLSFTIYGRKILSKTFSRRNNLAMQKIPFIGTICLNKPGILTLNKVTVTNLWFDGKTTEVWGGLKLNLKDKSSLTSKELTQCVALCTEAEFMPDQDDVPLTKREIMGTPNDIAMFRLLVHAIGKKVDKLKGANPKLYYAPYNESDKFQVSVHDAEGAFLIIIIGEPEFLLDKCTAFSMQGRHIPIGDNFRRDLDRACVNFAKYGDTIKCVIKQTIPQTDVIDWQQFKIPETGFVFLGMITFADMPRPNIAQTVAKCRQAGIKIILTTSDHPITARSFARNIGIITEGSQTLEEKHEARGDASRNVNAVVVDGYQLNKVSARTMQKLIDEYSEIVFARTSPIQRLVLIAACQKNSNSLVAVVGDEANDILTMKKADVSIGIGEEDQSKTKADIYLMDASFYSLAACIEEGRTVYENLKKCSAYILSANVSPVLGVFAYCILGIPLPVNPVGLLVLEITMECFPAVALIFEKGDQAVMERPPRRINGDGLWSRQLIFSACVHTGMFETFACFFTYFAIMLEYGWMPLSLIGIRDRWDSKAVTHLEDEYGQMWTYESRKHLENLCQTGFFYSLVVMQCANIFVCRNQIVSCIRYKERNWMIYFSILFDLSLMLFIVYLPFVSDFTQLKPLKPIWWLLPLPYLFLMLSYDEVRKYIIRRSPGGWLARETIY